MSKLDHHNGKTVTGVTENSITLEDGTVLRDLLSVIPDTLVGTKLLKVEYAGLAYLTFGHPRAEGPPIIVGVVEAAGDNLRGENE